MARLKRSHRCAGLVIGAAVGDALGAPFEFRRAGSYKQHFPTSEYGGIGELIGGGTFDWLPGEFTDDTQMAMSLALSILECGGFDPTLFRSIGLCQERRRHSHRYRCDGNRLFSLPNRYFCAGIR